MCSIEQLYDVDSIKHIEQITLKRHKKDFHKLLNTFNYYYFVVPLVNGLYYFVEKKENL